MAGRRGGSRWAVPANRNIVVMHGSRGSGAGRGWRAPRLAGCQSAHSLPIPWQRPSHRGPSQPGEHVPETGRWSAVGVALGVALAGVLAETWRRASREVALALAGAHVPVGAPTNEAAKPREV